MKFSKHFQQFELFQADFPSMTSLAAKLVDLETKEIHVITELFFVGALIPFVYVKVNEVVGGSHYLNETVCTKDH